MMTNAVKKLDFDVVTVTCGLTTSEGKSGTPCSGGYIRAEMEMTKQGF